MSKSRKEKKIRRKNFALIFLTPALALTIAFVNTTELLSQKNFIDKQNNFLS